MLRDAKRLGRYLLGGAVLGAVLGYLGRREFDSEFLLMIGFWLFFLSPLVLLVCIRRSFALTVLCLGAAVLAGLICATIIVAQAEASDKKAAMAYVDSIKPSLEDFRSKHGHYPETLGQVPFLPLPPSGLRYHHYLDSDPLDPETYGVDYGSLEYNSFTGQWFDDD